MASKITEIWLKTRLHLLLLRARAALAWASASATADRQSSVMMGLLLVAVVMHVNRRPCCVPYIVQWHNIDIEIIDRNPHSAYSLQSNALLLLLLRFVISNISSQQWWCWVQSLPPPVTWPSWTRDPIKNLMPIDPPLQNQPHLNQHVQSRTYRTASGW